MLHWKFDLSGRSGVGECAGEKTNPASPSAKSVAEPDGPAHNSASSPVQHNSNENKNDDSDRPLESFDSASLLGLGSTKRKKARNSNSII